MKWIQLAHERVQGRSLRDATCIQVLVPLCPVQSTGDATFQSRAGQISLSVSERPRSGLGVVMNRGL